MDARKQESFEPPRLRPVEGKCPECGEESWGLKVGTVCGAVAACYPRGHERPVEAF